MKDLCPKPWRPCKHLTPNTPTFNFRRYIAIQGSVSMDHWAINFRFDPEVCIAVYQSPDLHS